MTQPIPSNKPTIFSYIKTPEGRLAYKDSKVDQFPLVFIHGNSSSSKAFSFLTPLLEKQFRIITLDLIGHGQSDNSSDPKKSYSIPSYAKSVCELIDHLNLQKCVMIGHSLGGNIALQLSTMTNCVKGIALVSSAPISYSEKALEAYTPYEGNYAGHGEVLTEEQASEFMQACGIQTEDPKQLFAIQDAIRCDPQSRALMVATVFAGQGEDEPQIVKNLSIPLAVFEAQNEKAIKKGYLKSLVYKNLWRSEVFKIQDCEHSSILIKKADQLATLLRKFCKDVENT